MTPLLRRSLCTVILVPAFLSESLAQEVAQTLALPPITVFANPLNPSLFEYGKPVSVMGEEEIQSRLESTLGETIGLEPGVRSSFFGPGASRPIIRGFGGDRVRILKNGITTGDVSDISEDHAVIADPMQATQIEILRGPETLLYGSSAIGGAVNVTDDSIPEEALGKPFEGRILGQLGDAADDERTFGAKLRAQSGSFNWHLSGFSRETEDYEIPGFSESSQLRDQEPHDLGNEVTSGKVGNTATDTWGATAGGSYIWDRGFLGMSAGGFESDYGIPGHAHNGEDGGERGEENVRIETQQFRIDMRGRVDKVSDALESVKFRLGYAAYEHNELEGMEVGTQFERDAVEGRLEFLHAPIADISGVAGMQLLFDDFSALGEEAFLTPTETWQPALFLYEEYALLDNVRLGFGGRAEYVRHSPNMISSQDFMPFSVSAGPGWDLTGEGDYSIGLTFAFTERAPNSSELFADGPHVARQIFEIGDSGLGKESSWGVDLVLRKNSGVFQASLTPFYQGFSNFINLSGTGLENEGFPVFVYEQADVYFWGFEAESSLHLGELFDSEPHAFSLEHQIDFVQAKNNDSGGYLARIPPLRNILRARYAYNETIQALVECVLVEAQDDVAQFELPTDSYALVNAEISAKLTIFDQQILRFFIRGTNLTDDEARVHSSFLKDLAPLRGRSLLLGVAFQL